MSLLWNDRLLIALRPDSIALLRLSRGWKPAVKTKTVIACQPDSQLPKWKTAVAALAETMLQKEWHRTCVEVVLSQHFVRSAVMPANLVLKSSEEEKTFALHALAQASGEAGGNWQMRFADVQPGMPKLVSAVEFDLLDALEHAVSSARSTLVSVRPYFAAAYDGRRRLLSKQNAWFATLESDRCCLLHVQNGVVRHISNRRIFKDAENELPDFLEKERLLAQSDNLPDKVFLVAPEHLRLSLPPKSSLSATALPIRYCAGLSPHSDAVYGMALEAAA